MKKDSLSYEEKAFRRIHLLYYGVLPDGWTDQYKRDSRLFRAGMKAAQHDLGSKFFTAGFNCAQRKEKLPKAIFSLTRKPTATERVALKDLEAASIRALRSAERAKKKGKPH